MDSFDSQSPHTLNDDELNRLVAIVVEQFGADLRRRQFNDTVLAMFEDIAGLENYPDKDRSPVPRFPVVEVPAILQHEPGWLMT